MFVAGYVTLGIFSRKLCHHKIAGQIAFRSVATLY